jgi:uncharacterized membrane protein YgdD (TMEM256/DUF423 family)
MNYGRKWIAWGAVSAFLSVAIGAFGAHGLREILTESAKQTYETGVQYHIAHSLGLILIGLLASQWQGSKWIEWSGRLLLSGIILFSGSLYVLSITGVKILGAITPLGGLSFLAGWILVAAAALKSGKPK